MKGINIAIIGGGSSSVALLRSLINNLINHKNANKIKITIFEILAEIGRGIAYQKDLSTLLINRPLQTMSAHSIKLDEFQQWLTYNRQYLSNVITESTDKNDNRSYISREIFGFYLNDVFEASKMTAKQNGISVEIVYEYVENISGKSPFEIQTSNSNYQFQYIVLCTGNNNPADPYTLGETPQYIHTPYPIQKILPIRKEKSIGIIGTSLTAIDVAISLNSSGHTGKISMFSRGKIIPKVRGEISAHSQKFLIRENILKITKNKARISLRDVLRLLRKDLLIYGFKWKQFFSESAKDKNFFAQLENEISAQATEGKWQAIFSSTNELIDFCWKNFDKKSKELFLKRFHRIWLSNRTPIPVINAKKLLSMHNEGQLQVQFSVKNIYHNKDKNNYTVTFDDHAELECDYIINATGPSKYVTESDTLLKNLILNGMIRENRYGGIDVDFESSAVIDRNNAINRNIRLLGHNTAGVYYYVSSMQMIAKHAKRVADDLVNFILENNLR